MSAPAANLDHTGQGRMFAPAELRTPRRETEAQPVAEVRPVFRGGREVNICRLDAAQAWAGGATLYGPPIDGALAAILRYTTAPAANVRVENGEAIAAEPGVLAFLAPQGGRMAPFALVAGLTLDDARAALRRAA